MKIKWWGHAAFLFVNQEGTRVITDPYGDELPYKPIIDKADILTSSPPVRYTYERGFLKGTYEVAPQAPRI